MALAERFRPLGAVAWAQWRISRNVLLRARKGGTVVKALLGLFWYGSWAVGAIAIAMLTSGRVPLPVVERALPGALFLLLFFWQLLPVLLAAQGAFLDIRRLLGFPVPPGQLFLLETVLRTTTAPEMLLVSLGLAAGLAINPEVPFWGTLIVLAYVVFNLLLSAAVKSLLDSLFQKPILRELMVLLFLGVALLPQIFVSSNAGRGGLPQVPELAWLGRAVRLLPWSAASQLALGHARLAPALAFGAVLAAAFLFARAQFRRSLRLVDAEEAPRTGASGQSRVEFLATWPARVFSDPVAMIVEKDIRALARSPRFRLLFLMASTFGAVLWLPQLLRHPDGWMANNYMILAVTYGMLILGEVLYWNFFGFERASAQQWFVSPVQPREVLRAKNIVALFYTLASVMVLTGISSLLPIGPRLPQLADTVVSVVVFLVAILGAGNLSSIYLPRAVDPSRAWRANSSKAQILFLFAYPALMLPFALAFLARWATGSYWAFHGVMGVFLLISLCFYHAATTSAEEAFVERREQILTELAAQEGPMALNT